MIALDKVSVSRKPLFVNEVSIRWGPGIHAVVGTHADGCSLLLAAIVGAARPRRGRVRVLDEAPTDPRVRPQIARVGIEPALPESLRVDEVLALAAALRDEPRRSPQARLGLLGLEALAGRPVRSLSRGETRGVALAEALSSTRVRALVVEEPFVEMDARAVGRVPEAMRTKCRDGSTVVVTTASTRDAFALADDCATLRAGLLVADTTSVPQLLLRGPPDIVVVTRNEGQAKGLIAALADEPEIVGVELDANTVKARGSDRIGLARATGRAVARSKVDVVELRGSVS